MKINGPRWWVLALIFLAAGLNYVACQALSALSPTIPHDLGMDDRDYAKVVTLFLIACTLSYLVSGKRADTLGTRIRMFIFVAWRSVSNLLTAAAHGRRSLSACRFLLGLGEAAVWRAASKAVSEWFAPRERALATGLHTMGATIGVTVAPYRAIPLATFSHTKHLHFIARTRRGGRLADRVSPEGGDRTGLADSVVLALPVAGSEPVHAGRGTAFDRRFGSDGSNGSGGRGRSVLDLETGADVSGQRAAFAAKVDYQPGVLLPTILASKIPALGRRCEPGTA